MKNLKIALLGLMVMAVATLGTSFKASAQTTKYAVFNSTTAVPNGTTTQSLIDLIGTVSKWNALQTTDPGFSGSTNIASIRIQYAAGVPSPDIDNPSLQNFYTALENKYVNNGDIFAVSPNTFTISAVTNGSSHTYTIRVTLKN